MKASEELALSPPQKVDIQGSIRFVLDNIKNPQSRLILLNYFLGDDNDSKAVTEDKEAFEALQEILEGEFLQAKTWLNSPFFKSKQGDREPGPGDLARAIVECLDKLRAEDTQTDPEKNLEKYNHSVIFQYFQLAKPQKPAAEALPAQKPDPRILNIQDNNLENILKILAEKPVDLNHLKAFIEERGLDINHKYPPYGGTLLSYAAILELKHVLRFLLRSGSKNSDQNFKKLRYNSRQDDWRRDERTTQKIHSC